MKKMILVLIALGFPLLIAYQPASAETDPPFFPEFSAKKQEFPLAQPFTIDIQPNARAREMRIWLDGNAAGWMPFSTSYSFPEICATAKLECIREYKIAVQLRDEAKAPSPIIEKKAAVSNPGYTQKPPFMEVYFLINASGCYGGNQHPYTVVELKILNLEAPWTKVRLNIDGFKSDWKDWDRSPQGVLVGASARGCVSADYLNFSIATEDQYGFTQVTPERQIRSLRKINN